MPDLKTPDPTPGELIAQAIDRAHEESQDSAFRPHLGASVIGIECERALWYKFRWTTRAKFPGRILRLFRRGHREETTIVADLRMIGMEVLPENPATGDQWRYERLNGHFSGSGDGLGRKAPGFGDEPFLLEFKTHSTKSFNALVKHGIEKSKPVHVAQQRMYLHWQGFARSLYVAVCKDDDRLFVDIIEADPLQAAQLEAKALRVITAPAPPARISDDPDFFQCRFCDDRETCHGEKVAARTCRSCISSTPNVEEGAPQWICDQGLELTVDQQRAACDRHRYIPDLIPFAKAVDADPETRAIHYDLIASDGTTERFVNGHRSDGHYTSRELEQITPQLILDDGFALLRDKFDGELLSVEEVHEPGEYDEFFVLHPESGSALATSCRAEADQWLKSDPLCAEVGASDFAQATAREKYEITDNRGIPF